MSNNPAPKKNDDNDKIIQMPRQRPTVVIADDMRRKLATLWDAADGQEDLQNILRGINKDLKDLVEVNRDLANKFADEAEARMLEKYNRHLTEEYAQKLRENTIEEGVKLFSQLLSRDLDMHPKDVQRVVQMIMGELPEGHTDTVPPYHINQIRETFEDIARMCLEEEIELADFEADREDDG